MKTLIIYDSYYGNTEKVAREITTTLNAKAIRADNAKPEVVLNNIEWLIVGSPTRAFRPTKAVTDFISSLPKNSLKNVNVAAFDTGIAEEDAPVTILRLCIKTFGYASKNIAKSLVKKGGILKAAPQTFWVEGTKGPLKEGELKRASFWAKNLQTS